MTFSALKIENVGWLLINFWENYFDNKSINDSQNWECFNKGIIGDDLMSYYTNEKVVISSEEGVMVVSRQLKFGEKDC